METWQAYVDALKLVEQHQNQGEKSKEEKEKEGIEVWSRWSREMAASCQAMSRHVQH